MNELTLLAKDVGVNERTLRRAVSQGALRASRPTPRTLKLSLPERLYIRRSWPLLFTLRKALRTEQNVRFAMLFGSAATGDDTAKSDIDIIVSLRDPDLERVVDLGTKLTESIGRHVDIIRLEDAEDDSPFFVEALSDGRVLVDREKLWPRLLRRKLDLQERGHTQQTRRTRAALAGIDRLLDG